MFFPYLMVRSKYYWGTAGETYRVHGSNLIPHVFPSKTCGPQKDQCRISHLCHLVMHTGRSGKMVDYLCSTDYRMIQKEYQTVSFQSQQNWPPEKLALWESTQTNGLLTAFPVLSPWLCIPSPPDYHLWTNKYKLGGPGSPWNAASQELQSQFQWWASSEQ